MENDTNKIWNKPWNTNEIINNSENWSLAGDAALLNSIKVFADNMFMKTMQISDNVDSLLQNLHEIGLQLDISQNEFRSLRNIQFIESRVYEDDETIDSKKEEKVAEKEPSEEEKNKMIKESVLTGLEVIEKYFDNIEVSISDSEEELDKSYILQPKDLYSDRPLPLVIGTEEWYKKWHVNLIDSSSESDSDSVSEVYSVSDSEDNLPKNMFKGSETGSEMNFSDQTNENKLVAKSTFNDYNKKQELLASSDEEISGPAMSPVLDSLLAEHVAAKLGSVVSREEDIMAEINKKPLQASQANRFIGDLFSDEPPPLDNLVNTVDIHKAHADVSSGRQGLFDDDEEDELFWGQKVPTDKAEQAKGDDGQKNPLPNEVAQKNMSFTTSSQVSKGLFDSDSSSDDDIFTTTKKQVSKEPFLRPFNTVIGATPLFDDEPPELDIKKEAVEEPLKKTTINGTPIFSSSNILTEHLTNTSLKTSDYEVDFVESKKISEDISQGVTEQITSEEDGLFDDVDNKNEMPVEKKHLSLFDDDDDFFKEDLFSNITSKTFSSSLFGDLEKDPEYLFGVNNNRVTNNLSEKEAKGDLFQQKTEDVVNNNSLKIDSIIDGLQNVGKSRVKKGGEEEGKKESLDFVGDIYTDIKNLKSEPSSIWETDNVKKNISLFNSTPPPDDDWEIKSNNFSDTEDQFSYHVEDNIGQLNLFDEEPPSLGPNESSSIIRDQHIARVDTDDSSFHPHASSSRRLPLDIFNDQQSQDSFFVTKTQPESVVIPPDLDIVPEKLRNSNSEFMPSNNLEDSGSIVDSLNFQTESHEKETNLLHEETEKTNDFFSIHNEEKIQVKKLNNQNQDITETCKNVSTYMQKLCQTPVQSVKTEAMSGTEPLQNKLEKELPNESKGSPRKIKHNLDINVNALKPGFAPPKLKNFNRSLSLDLSKVQDISANFTSRDVPEQSTNPASRFDYTAEGVEILQSITKDRAKIPIKRKPSTRKGRQEAIRKSAVLEKESIESDSTSVLNIVKEDFLKKEEREVIIQEKKIFANKSDAHNPPRSIVTKENSQSGFAKHSIFDSEDSDSELFSSSGKKKTNKRNAVTTVLKTSLFNDSSSDDDLFSAVKSRNDHKKSIFHPTGKRTQKSSTLRKLDNVEVDDDPLFSALK